MAIISFIFSSVELPSDKLLLEMIASVAAMFVGLEGIMRVFSGYKKVRLSDMARVEEIAETVRMDRESRATAAVEVMARQAMEEKWSPENFKEILDIVVQKIGTPSNDVSEPVEELVKDYHEQALSQASVQFWFSVVAATIGFIWILFAGYKSIEEGQSILKILPGFAIDAVAGLFFSQAEATRRRATELYDRLRTDKNMTDAKAMVSTIEDVQLRGAVKAHLALHMAGMNPTPIDLGKFLTPGQKPYKASAATEV